MFYRTALIGNTNAPCPLCKQGNEDITHFIFDCPKETIAQARNDLFRLISNTMPEFANMDEKSKLKLLLNITNITL